LQLEIVDLDQDLPGLHEVAAIGVDPANIAGDLREDRGLLGGDDVGREGELDLHGAALRRDDADQHVRPRARDRARLLVLEPVHDEDTDDDEQAEQDQADAVSPQHVHGRSLGPNGPRR
jgi:hypothetical protein